MPNNQTLGQKIRNFRKQSGLSQLELENKIGASPGSISRIEADKVNPKKETIMKIIDVLNLKAHEIMILYNQEQAKILQFLNISSQLVSTFSLDEILSKAANMIAKELNLLGIIIDIVKGNELWCNTFTTTWYTPELNKILGVPFKTFHIRMQDFKDNLCVRAIQEQRVFKVEHIREIACDFMSMKICDLLQKVTKPKSARLFPIIGTEGKSLGCIAYGKSYEDDFSSDYEILEAFTKQIAIAIENAQKYEIIQQKLMDIEGSREQKFERHYRYQK